MAGQDLDTITAEEAAELFGALDQRPQQVHDRLMAVESVDNLIPRNRLSIIGILVDVSSKLGNVDGIENAIEFAEELDQNQLSEEHLAQFYYIRGNAYSSLHKLRHGEGGDWRWENEELEEEILSFRQALGENRIELVSTDRQCRIFTNLGNSLSGIGRFIEAIAYWNEANDRHETFAQAYGQRGIGYYNYALIHYDQGHQFLLLRHAYRELETALNLEANLYPEMVTEFQRYQNAIESMLSPEQLTEEIDLDGYSLGESPDEQHYRQWCLDNRLFLNSLNDLGAHPTAAQDILHLASVASENENEIVSSIGLYNHMKQEYVSARYQLYEGMHATEPHFSDRDVYLVNTLDYPSHSLATEKSKIAFRMAYSIFDKIGFFLNYYFDRGIKDYQVNFKRVWYDSRSRNTLADVFNERKNWPLRGLFWLSKDLEYQNPMHVEGSLDPGANELADIRNSLEHQYLKLHDMLWSGTPDDDPQRLIDELAKSMPRNTFEQRALDMIQRARAALVYLSLAIQIEEQDKKQSSDGTYGPLYFGDIDDEWKR